MGHIDGVIPAIPIQVQVATGGVYRVALQPAGGAGVVFAGADMVQTGGGRLLISIGGVPAEGVEGGADLLDRVAPCIVTITVGDIA